MGILEGRLVLDYCAPSFDRLNHITRLSVQIPKVVSGLLHPSTQKRQLVDCDNYIELILDKALVEGSSGSGTRIH